MSDYDIGEAFAKIEDELIASMMRNIDRHRAEETKEGYEWSMWQTEQLQALERYKKENAKKYPGQFKDINDRISALISIAHDEGRMKQEEAILKAIRNGFRGAKKRGKGIEGEFFKLNERKLEALINATMKDMQHAETAILRMANDKYRSTIFNAQVYYNTGAGTFEKAVDMATKDMLAAGLNCVQYKNGARHRLEDYAGMAIRTASTRAKLYGEGEMRQEWGVHTVIMNKRSNPCPKCLPYVGKVMIDDVWSGGKASDGPYPLMSSAIAAGLYHPNCKDMHTTFFPGISDAPDDTWTPAELEDVQMFNEQEARQQYAERQEEKFGRLAKYSLDTENKKRYEVRRQQWKNKVDYMSNSFRPKYGNEESIDINNADINVKNVQNSKFNMVTDEGNTRNKAVRLAEKMLREIHNNLPENFEMPNIAVINFKKHGIGKEAIGGYDRNTVTLYINSKYDTKQKIKLYVNRNPGWFADTSEYAPYLHELGHKFYYDSVKKIAISRGISYNKAINRVDARIGDYVHELALRGKSLKTLLSRYAENGYRQHDYTEIIAESFTVKDSNLIAADLIRIIQNEVNI